jgi:uncharacterized protein (DUF433 family)
MTTAATSPTQHPYVTRQPGVCGGNPTIAGTRIRVSHIAIEYDVMGWTPEEILEAHPHLNLAQVHDALSYYYENTGEIQAEIREGEALVESLQRNSKGSVLDRKRGSG